MTETHLWRQKFLSYLIFEKILNSALCTLQAIYIWCQNGILEYDLVTFVDFFSVSRLRVLTRISRKDSRKGSSQKNIRSNFKNLVPGVFEIWYVLFM